MNDFHGIIFAYAAAPELGALVRTRTSASLPFCGRYRLIDFALSSLANAGIYNVGVIMRDSNPGSVTLAPGGVGRNIAHDLRLLDVDVTFVTALGGDGDAAKILKSCEALGFDMVCKRFI